MTSHLSFLVSSLCFPSALPARASQLVKNPPAVQETLLAFLGWKDPLEKWWATHCIILAWRVP